MDLLNQMRSEFQIAMRYEYLCAIVAAVCLATALVWPASAVLSAVIAFAAFCSVLSHYRLHSPTNLAFLFLSITLIVAATSSDTWIALQDVPYLPSLIDNDTRHWAMRYVAMTIDAMALGACLVRLKRRDVHILDSSLRKEIQFPWIYLTAAFIPLLLNLALYYLKLRGSGYEGLQEVGQGPYRRIFLLIIVSHAAFLRLLGGWPYLGRTARLTFGVAICLFLYIYVFLLSTRTNLFIFGVYVYYFFGWRIRWYVKVAALATILILFGWIANYRSVSYEGIKGSDFVGTVEGGIGIGTDFMLDMVHWANDEVRKNGCTWGATSLMATTNHNPANEYVEEKAPAFAEAGGGFGFFYVAELVLDFGFVGGLFGACILGAALQRISTAQRGVFRSTVLPALLGASFPLVRNVFLMTLKTPIYIIIGCVMLDRLAVYAHELVEHIKPAELPARTR